MVSVTAHAQLCTTQSKLAPALRETLSLTTMTLATAIKAGDVTAVRTNTTPALAGNFAGTEGLLKATGAKLSGDTLQVTQLYVLDATARKASDTGSADFTCPLADSAASETDFSIGGLPSGRFSFAMVEAAHGAHPWLMSFLLEQDSAPSSGTNGSWKMAGFYPHPREAGGHDGLWYWSDARAKVAAKQPWLAWLEFGEADTLLRPANFVSSTHLDALHAEQHAAAPAGLGDDPSAESPLVVKAADGAEFRLTQLSAQAENQDGPLQLVVHVEAQGSTESGAMRARGTAAVQALMTAHPELRSAFTGALVFVDTAGGSPEVFSLAMGSLR